VKSLKALQEQAGSCEEHVLVYMQRRVHVPAALASDDLPWTAGSPNLVFINVSPIEYGHVLLVPRALSKLNQQVDVESLQLALQFAHEANNPYFRLAFNSLGAYGTVNHLHFQVCAVAALALYQSHRLSCLGLRDLA